MRKPLAILKSIEGVSIKTLVDAKKTILFLDADNTLFLPQVPLAQQKLKKVSRQLKAFQAAGFSIVIISNNFSAEKADFFDMLTLPSIFFAKKPLPFAYRQAHKTIEKTLGRRVKKSEIVHIGDQLLTDGFGSIVFGIDYILVEPIDKKNDLIFAKPSRWLEKILRLQRKK